MLKSAAMLLPLAAVLLTGCFSSAAPEGKIVTVRGEANATAQKSAPGTRKAYRGFSSPTATAVDASGNLYVSNWGGGNVIKVDTDGNYTVFADGMGAPAGLTFDGAGNLYVSDYSRDVIYRVSPEGDPSVVARGLHTPTGIFFSARRGLLVCNRGSDEIVCVTGAGNVATVAAGMNTPVGVVEDADGNIFVTNYGGGVKKVSAHGDISDMAWDFIRPGVGIDVAPDGRIFAADNGAGCVRQISPDGATRIVADNIGGCVGVKVHDGKLFVTGWQDGAVYACPLD